MPIKAVNVRGMRPNAPGVTYVGRPCAGWNGSPLRNTHKAGTREQNIQLFRLDMQRIARRGVSGHAMEPADKAAWTALLDLARQVKAGAEVQVGCWCKPLDCHADVIVNAVKWLIDRQVV